MLPTDIPSKISVDVSALKIGEALTVAQLPKIEGVEYENDPTNIVVNILAQVVEEKNRQMLLRSHRHLKLFQKARKKKKVRRSKKIIVYV
jgi:hypothetical protein